MDIEKFILQELGSADGIHSKRYKECIRSSFDMFKDLDIDNLQIQLNEARKRYGDSIPTHQNTADCMVLYELLQEAKGL